MRLTDETDFALRTLLYVAFRSRQEPEQGCVSGREIAEYLGVPEQSLEAVSSQLVDRGYLKVQDESNGGLRLARACDEINLGEVVRSFEGPLLLVEHHHEAENDETDALSRLWRTLDWAGRSLESFLGQYTLDQLLPRSGRAADKPGDPATVRRRGDHLQLVNG